MSHANTQKKQDTELKESLHVTHTLLQKEYKCQQAGLLPLLLTRSRPGSAQIAMPTQLKAQILSLLVGLTIAIIQSHHSCSQILDLTLRAP